MNRIDKYFEDSRLSRRKALIAYLTAGYPSVEATIEIAAALVEGDCDMIELGIPFSDPLADGATIQRASHRALETGMTPQRCLDVAAELRRRVDVPLIFMGYYNPILHYGLNDFCKASSDAGIDGLIVPDLPPEEGEELEAIASGNGIDLIYLLAPTTTSAERIRLVADRSRGFIYVVSLKGVTGTRSAISTDLDGFISKVRNATSKPLCVGFGISTPEQAGRVAALSDGVIIGSRIIDIVENSESPTADVKAFVKEVRTAIDA
ncbi:MAG: tryptophan synthase subunit alpha [Chloroflexota bacterium]|nr:tryptophan synthase subunit alpha [Chloroflexota bacterium]